MAIRGGSWTGIVVHEKDERPRDKKSTKFNASRFSGKKKRNIEGDEYFAKKVEERETHKR